MDTETVDFHSAVSHYWSQVEMVEIDVRIKL